MKGFLEQLICFRVNQLLVVCSPSNLRFFLSTHPQSCRVKQLSNLCSLGFGSLGYALTGSYAICLGVCFRILLDLLSSGFCCFAVTPLPLYKGKTV